MRNRQSGLTLIETILVLLVAAIIIGGIWMAYSQLNLNSQVERTVKVLDETLAVTRDYLSSKSTVPGTLSDDLYNQRLMPPELTYAYPATKSPWNDGVYSTTQIFISPLGTEFFVQFPGSVTPLTGGTILVTKIFEVRIRFINSTGTNFINPTGTNNVSRCMALVPKLIGTTSVMANRGMVGYWYGSNPTEASWLSSVDGNPTPVASTATLPALNINTATQLSACKSANDIRLYFFMRP